MKTVRKTSVFPAKRDAVFAKLQELSTLQYIAAPYATFTPVDSAQSATWSVGSTSAYRFRLFGFIPFGTHTIHIERFDRDGIRSREGNEHVPVWNHKIYLNDRGDGTEYTDEVDIDAGRKTPFVWLWANAFYAHRQKKWIRLLDNDPSKGRERLSVDEIKKEKCAMKGTSAGFTNRFYENKKDECCDFSMRKTELVYRTELSDAKWMAYDIPGNIGWIAFFIGFGKLIGSGSLRDVAVAAVPTALMATGIGELISERLTGLDRELPAERFYRGFGALTLGGITGIAAGLLTGTDRKTKAVMSGGAALCALFSGLIMKEFKIEQ